MLFLFRRLNIKNGIDIPEREKQTDLNSRDSSTTICLLECIVAVGRETDVISILVCLHLVTFIGRYIQILLSTVTHIVLQCMFN